MWPVLYPSHPVSCHTSHRKAAVHPLTVAERKEGTREKQARMRVSSATLCGTAEGGGSEGSPAVSCATFCFSTLRQGAESGVRVHCWTHIVQLSYLYRVHNPAGTSRVRRRKRRMAPMRAA